jgi:protein O-mannosyl-transferase
MRHPRDSFILAALFLLPNLVTLGGAFVWDDFSQLVDNESAHSLWNLGRFWTESFTTGSLGEPLLYRPLTRTLWAALWTLGDGSPVVFHLANLILGTAVVLLAQAALLRLGCERSMAFVAAALFALLPIHTEAVAPVVGSSELLAAVLCFSALLAYLSERRGIALVLLAGATLSKESAVAFPFAILLAFDGPAALRRHRAALAASTIVLVAAFAANRSMTSEHPFLTLFNPIAALPVVWRVISALWVQLLYLARTVVPVNLSADYSYNQIPVVASLADPRAWAGLALAAGTMLLAARVRAARTPIALTVILFAPTANVLFPIGTIMGERLAYLPSFGAALGAARILVCTRRWPVLLGVLAATLGVCSFARNLTWADSDRFTANQVRTAPLSANAWFQRGAFLEWLGRDEEAVARYDQALGILPEYPDALFNRANTLVRLERLKEAERDYRSCLAILPGHEEAARALGYLQAGIRFRTSARPF